MEWLIAAGHHPRATATTLSVAEDLADRMDYTTGHVRYCLDEMAARLDLSRATVKRHVGYLRELGALAWVQHGTRANIRRLLGIKGYAATATVYAAVIPPVYDEAMGHTVIGSGYAARIVVDLRGRHLPAPRTDSAPSEAEIEKAEAPVDNRVMDDSSSAGLEPPSLTVEKEEGKLKVDGGEENYTSRERASRDRASIPTQKSSKNRSSGKGTGRHALQVAEDIRIARQVRPLVTWTQREGLRRLAFALRPLIDRGLDAYGITGFLNGLCDGTRWRPNAPANYIRTVLADRQQRADLYEAAQAAYELENPTPGAFTARIGQQIDVMAALRQGITRYQQDMRARGHDDLSGADTTTWNAEADILAFLNGSPS
ncbi:cell wall protein [Streptomyces caniscabiei]|uniref:cell wall protein n=1 Tax=Streptomyces caniscabiei TaxID=2746961 RepID=UPI0018721B17|nr:cell wall protein [Streptomyces caniscabiei]MBE4761786.1 cell wall protein [Streptomyces caniscabiei]